MDKMVRSWMSRQVVSVPPDATARQAMEAMGECGVRHVLVQEEEGELLGMISNRDLVRVVLRNFGRVFDLEGASAKDIMTPAPLHTTHPDASLAAAARLLEEHQISALPVIEDGALRGILTTSDLLRTISQGEEASP